MGSSERDQTRQHQPPHISSLVVRPSGREYEPGEVSRHRPSYARSNGHRTRASSGSPPRRAYGSDLNNHSGRGRELSSRRETSGRLRAYSPPCARGGAAAPPHGRGFDPEPFKSNTPKVLPRDGDWYCQDPLCRNLNFMRRECCYKCKKPRYGPVNTCSPPRHPMNLDRSPPPRAWPRDYPPPRHDHPTWRDHGYPPSRRIASDWVHPHCDRRPPFSPSRGGGWGRLSRERSRSPPPNRGGPPPLRDYRRGSYYERGGREDRDRSVWWRQKQN